MVDILFPTEELTVNAFADMPEDRSAIDVRVVAVLGIVG